MSAAFLTNLDPTVTLIWTTVPHSSAFDDWRLRGGGVTIDRRELLGGKAAALLVGAAPPSTSHLAPVEAAAHRVLQARAIPGVAICIMRKGEVVLDQSFGVANIELNAATRPDSIFRVGSIAKQFTSAAVLLLMEDGKLSLEDPLSLYFPSLAGAERITLSRLLNHTSGLWNYATMPMRDYRREIRIERSTDDLVRLILERKDALRTEPGTAYAYSNSGYVLLGAIIERITGNPYPQLLAERLFKPHRLTSTDVEQGREIIKGRVAGYSNDHEAPTGFRNAAFQAPSFLGASGNLRSSARDLAQWAHKLTSGEVLRPSSLALMTKPGRLKDGSLPKRSDGGEIRYGLGVRLDPVRERACYSHLGQVQGYVAYLAAFPGLGVSICMLANSDGGDGPGVGGAEQEGLQSAIYDLALA